MLPFAGSASAQHGGVDIPGGSDGRSLAEQGPGDEDERPLGGSSLSSLESLVRVSKELLRRESDISVARQSDVGAFSAFVFVCPDGFWRSLFVLVPI